MLRSDARSYRHARRRRLRQHVPRQIDREDASSAGDVADAENAVHRLDADATDRQSESQAGLVRVALLERQKQLIRVAWWQAAAVIPDVDPDPIGGGVRAQRDVSVVARELE